MTAAKLGDLKKATPLLLQLTRAKGEDPEVRLPMPHLLNYKQDSIQYLARCFDYYL